MVDLNTLVPGMLIVRALHAVSILQNNINNCDILLNSQLSVSSHTNFQNSNVHCWTQLEHVQPLSGATGTLSISVVCSSLSWLFHDEYKHDKDDSEVCAFPFLP